MAILLPILLAVLYGLASYRFSVWRSSARLDSQSTELIDADLNELADQMAVAIDLPRIKVYIYEIEPVNGFASADGRIFITRGFFDRHKRGEFTSEEMASVIAHELGHVALGHSRRRMVDFTGQNAVRVALGMFISRFIPGAGPWIAGQLMRLMSARLSRNDEFEADAYASALLIKAGIGTGPQKNLFAKFEKMKGPHAASPPAWLRSHPKSHQRIAAIEANDARWQA